MQVSWSTVSTAQEICNGVSKVGYSLWSQLGQLEWSVVALAPQSYHQKIIFCPDFEILIFLNKFNILSTPKSYDPYSGRLTFWNHFTKFEVSNDR